MENFFEVNGRRFETASAFPPIDDEKIQNAIMIAPYNNQMYVYGWNCWIDTDNENTNFWGWEPLFPLSSHDKEFLSLIMDIRKNLGI